MKRRNLLGSFILPFLGLGKKKETEYVGKVMWTNSPPKKNMFGGYDEGNFPSNSGKRIKDCRQDAIDELEKMDKMLIDSLKEVNESYMRSRYINASKLPPYYGKLKH